MRSALTTYRTMALVALAIGLFVTSTALAQTPPPANPTVDASRPSRNESDAMDKFEAELKSKQELRLAEKQHRENVDRAELLSTLGNDLAQSYKRKSSLDREDLKKLEKLEKLAKGIRGAAGGEDDENESQPPKSLELAVSKMAETAVQLRDSVRKTPRHVISAAVISQANELLELIRAVKSLLGRA